MKFLWLFWEVIIVGFLVGFLCLVDINPDKVSYNILNITFFDKIVHFVMYFFFSIAVLRAFRKSKKFLLRYIIFTVLIALFYGIIIEVIQYIYIPTRNADVYDILANLIGALCGVLLTEKYKSKNARFVI